MIFQIRPSSPPLRPGSAPSPEKGERGGAPQFLGGARVACLEAPAPWRVTLPVDAAAVPPGPHLGPLPSSSAPLCVRGWGPGPQVGRRAGWRGERVWTRAALSRPCLAGRRSCRRRRCRRRPRPSASPGETRAVPIASALAQVRGRVGLGRICVGSTLLSISGPQPGQNQGGVASSRLLAAASTHLLLVCRLYLQHGDLNTGYPRSVRRPERAMTVRWLGPRMQELARWMVVRQAGDAHLLVCGKDHIPASSGSSLVSCMGLHETLECLTEGRLWTKGRGAFETLSTPQVWCACILIGACGVYTMEEYISAETSFDQRKVKRSWLIFPLQNCPPPASWP